MQKFTYDAQRFEDSSYSEFESSVQSSNTKCQHLDQKVPAISETVVIELSPEDEK